jgi:hypothetical protein
MQIERLAERMPAATAEIDAERTQHLERLRVGIDQVTNQPVFELRDSRDSVRLRILDVRHENTSKTIRSMSPLRAPGAGGSRTVRSPSGSITIHPV